MFWIGLTMGLFVGVALGLFTAGLCAMAARRDNRNDINDLQPHYPSTEQSCSW